MGSSNGSSSDVDCHNSAQTLEELRAETTAQLKKMGMQGTKGLFYYEKFKRFQIDFGRGCRVMKKAQGPKDEDAERTTHTKFHEKASQYFSAKDKKEREEKQKKEEANEKRRNKRQMI